MTSMTSIVIDFVALDQIRAKARVERSKAFWSIWAAARTAIANRLISVGGSAHLARA